MAFKSVIDLNEKDLIKILAEYFGEEIKNVSLSYSKHTDGGGVSIYAKVVKTISAPEKHDNLTIVPAPSGPTITSPYPYNPWNPVIYCSSNDDKVKTTITTTSSNMTISEDDLTQAGAVIQSWDEAVKEKREKNEENK